MSLKKDKSSEKNKAYMRLALELANQNKGLTGLNPSVGCVVTYKDEIISYGKTDINGRPHAEVAALKNNKIDFKNDPRKEKTTQTELFCSSLVISH